MDTFSNIPGGWGGIRTPGGVAPTTVFKTVAIDRSATHPKLFSRRSFKPAVLFAVRTWARVTWHILHKFFTNAIAKYFVTAFYMPMRFLYDTVILYPYIHAYNRPK